VSFRIKHTADYVLIENRRDPSTVRSLEYEVNVEKSEKTVSCDSL